MRLSEICIERPVFATVLSLLITLLGLIALFRLPNRELPDVHPPIVSVTTVYPGAAPEVVETSITEPLENELIGIEGIKHVTSISREQVSGITLEFDLSRDVDLAAADVRDRVARARNRIPEDVEEPIVAKQDADAALCLAALAAARRLAVSRLAKTSCRQVANTAGLAIVVIAGAAPSRLVWIDTAAHLAPLTVADIAVRAAENVASRPAHRGPDASSPCARGRSTRRARSKTGRASVKGQPVLLATSAASSGPRDRAQYRPSRRAAVGLASSIFAGNTIASRTRLRGDRDIRGIASAVSHRRGRRLDLIALGLERAALPREAIAWS